MTLHYIQSGFGPLSGLKIGVIWWQTLTLQSYQQKLYILQSQSRYLQQELHQINKTSFAKLPKILPTRVFCLMKWIQKEQQNQRRLPGPQDIRQSQQAASNPNIGFVFWWMKIKHNFLFVPSRPSLFERLARGNFFCKITIDQHNLNDPGLKIVRESSVTLDSSLT